MFIIQDEPVEVILQLRKTFSHAVVLAHRITDSVYNVARMNSLVAYVNYSFCDMYAHVQNEIPTAHRSVLNIVHQPTLMFVGAVTRTAHTVKVNERGRNNGCHFGHTH